MSEFLVLDELGSEKSSVVESTHADEHSEFGATCNVEAGCVIRRRDRSRSVVLIVEGAMISELGAPLKDTEIYGRAREWQSGPSLGLLDSNGIRKLGRVDTRSLK
jgi:hypothetical protein